MEINLLFLGGNYMFEKLQKKDKSPFGESEHPDLIQKDKEMLIESITNAAPSSIEIVKMVKNRNITYERIDKHTYYLNIAKHVAKRGTCLRTNYGAVIVKNDEIISTGYTGAPRGEPNCNEIGKCVRIEQNIPSGQRYELCKSVHAEMNAIISASRRDMCGATLYLYGWDVQNNCEKIGPKPCTICERLIKNAGINCVITFDPDDKENYGKEDCTRKVIVYKYNEFYSESILQNMRALNNLNKSDAANIIGGFFDKL